MEKYLGLGTRGESWGKKKQICNNCWLKSHVLQKPFHTKSCDCILARVISEVQSHSTSASGSNPLVKLVNRGVPLPTKPAIAVGPPSKHPENVKQKQYAPGHDDILHYCDERRQCSVQACGVRELQSNGTSDPCAERLLGAVHDSRPPAEYFVQEVLCGSSHCCLWPRPRPRWHRGTVTCSRPKDSPRPCCVLVSSMSSIRLETWRGP